MPQTAKVTLTQPVAVDEVDAEIVVVEGVALPSTFHSWLSWLFGVLCSSKTSKPVDQPKGLVEECY